MRPHSRATASSLFTLVERIDSRRMKASFLGSRRRPGPCVTSGKKARWKARPLISNRLAFHFSPVHLGLRWSMLSEQSQLGAAINSNRPHRSIRVKVVIKAEQRQLLISVLVCVKLGPVIPGLESALNAQVDVILQLQGREAGRRLNSFSGTVKGSQIGEATVTGTLSVN